ncbi:hypothetical protein LEN26_006149 [Aphanomyces euteiches]|nr:hypothetical protein AeMF1_017064 [Aphanomyces euteiches]KAH9136479.1 hypothetical protein LEN26_006149 [Aphanomyces euteiches]
MYKVRALERVLMKLEIVLLIAENRLGNFVGQYVDLDEVSAHEDLLERSHPVSEATEGNTFNLVKFESPFNIPEQTLLAMRNNIHIRRCSEPSPLSL